MKTLTTIIFVAVLASSGCAPVGYQRGYTGYGSGYTVQRYYGGYPHSYYRPGTDSSYGQYQMQPRFERDHRETAYQHDRHPGWSAGTPRFNHQAGGHDGRNTRQTNNSMPDRHHVERAASFGVRPHQQQTPQHHGNSGGGNRSRDERGNQHHDRHGHAD